MTRSSQRPAEPALPQRPGRRATQDSLDAPGAAASTGKRPARRSPAAYQPPSCRQRLRRVAASLIGVVLFYCAYDLLAVPLIEPSTELVAEREASDDDLTYASQSVQRQREELAAWFSPGDWELTAPKVLGSRKGLLIYQSYQTLPDRSVEIRPCTLVFLPQGQFADEADRRRRAIVLQARLLVLKFDKGLDMKHARIGKLDGGEMLGPVTIRSDQREPGPHDDLWMTTGDMKLIGDRLVTPHPVDFRLGQSAGHGRNLVITLAPADAAKAEHGQPFAGLRSLELTDDVWLRVQADQTDLFPNPVLAEGAAPQPRPSGALAAPRGNQPPLEVQCAGPFRFDMEAYKATFERTVVVSRINASGPSDQLTCELLTLLFETAATSASRSPPGNGAAKAAAEKTSGIPKLELARIVATGSPVIIRSPARGAQARGQQLEYNVKTQSGSLSGPGTLKGLAPATSGSGAGGLGGPSAPRPVEAAWSKQLLFRPQDNEQVLSIEGDADVQVAGTGRIKAGEIHLWLIEQADPAARSASGATATRRRLVPARLMARGGGAASSPTAPTVAAARLSKGTARGRVEIDSPQLTGEVGELQAWFDYASPATPAVGGAGPNLTADRDPLAPVDLNAPVAPLVGPPGTPGASGAAPGPVAPQSGPQQQYHIDGDLVRMQVVVRGRAAEVTAVDIQGKVRFDETRTARPDEAPLLVLGEHVHFKQPQPRNAAVSVTGQPAHVEARGMTIEAAAIDVDQAANRAWSGPGTMTFPVDRDLEGNPLPRPQRIELTWKGGMEFDGQRARFERDVVARLEEQRLATSVLVATFSRPIRFGEGGTSDRPEIDRVDCLGGVFLERRARTDGRLASIEKLQTVDLTIQQRSGELSAQGPGWLSSVRIDTGEGWPGVPGLARGAGGPAGSAAAKARSAGAGSLPREGLAYLGVRFQGQITGNQRNRVMVFHRQVRTIYGPVSHWEAELNVDDFDSQRDRAVLMDSDQLTVSQVPSRPGVAPSYALEAKGNVTVDGNYDGATYWANAARLTYEQAKDLLVLEGDGTGPAKLSRQAVLGGQRPTTEAGQILFRPSTNEVKVPDGRYIDAGDLTGPLGGLRRDSGGR